MKQEYDLTIAGAGPAGLMAAVTAAQEGLEVALIERKTKISSIKRSCCTALINEPGTHEEFVTLEDNKIVFHRSDFSVPYEGPSIPLKQLIKFSPKGNKFVVERNEDPVAIALNKECILEGLLKKAKELGVTILSGTHALKAENVDNKVIITVKQDDKTSDITSKTAIAADGVNSKIVESLGLNKNRKFFGNMHAMTYYLKDVECPYPPAWMVFVGRGHTPSRKGQIYFLPKPQKDGSSVYEITYGHPVFDESAMQEDVKWFLEKSTFSSWFKKATIVKRLSAVLKFCTPILEPRAGRILIVGDAASYIEVYVQGALMYGYHAAISTAKFLKEGSGLDDYVEFWKKTFAYNQPGAIEAAMQAFGLHVLEDEEIDYLFSLTDRETYKGYVNEHFSKETTMGALMSHMGEIKRDKPELAAKIEKFDQVSTEEFLQVTKKDKK
ncbi:MAG: NAD(P)/FAD-dependent oxidoreductase [Deltaproteobacteria bacterium]|nr:NAD(P)/FAD-dependent oxidoreductase [Deltaproteobacteria bacterium]